MRIAVFSDTHDRFPRTLPGMLKGADELWHLGDVCEPSTLDAFVRLGRPLHVVLGNCDSQLDWPVALELERGKMKFHLTHIPPTRAPRGVHAVLHGHLHVPRDEMIANVRWLSPGCITRPSGGFPPSFAWLMVEAGQLTWETVPLR